MGKREEEGMKEVGGDREEMAKRMGGLGGEVGEMTVSL